MLEVLLFAYVCRYFYFQKKITSGILSECQKQFYNQNNKANSFDTEAPFLDLNLSITNGIVSSKGVTLHINNSLCTNYENVFIELDS